MSLRKFFIGRTIVMMLIIIIGGAIYLISQPKSEEPAIANSGESAFLRNLNIKSYAVVSSPLTVTGEARGSWFFEASFPIMLTDWDGKIIASGIATTKSDWMTNEFVPFSATLIFNKSEISGSYSNKGTLIFKKDNPSGLPEHDDALEIPVVIN